MQIVHLLTANVLVVIFMVQFGQKLGVKLVEHHQGMVFRL